MTGQVKEDILTRIGELGVNMKDGKLHFKHSLLHKTEFLSQDTVATFILFDGNEKKVTLDNGSLAFTVCQVPVIYKIDATNKIELSYKNGTKETLETLELNNEQSNKIFHRTGAIEQVMVFLKKNELR